MAQKREGVQLLNSATENFIRTRQLLEPTHPATGRAHVCDEHSWPFRGCSGPQCCGKSLLAYCPRIYTYPNVMRRGQRRLHLGSQTSLKISKPQTLDKSD